MVIAIVQARLNSQRFPRKALVDINGAPMIVHVLNRARQIKGVDMVLAAIPQGDTALERVIRDAGVFPVLGSEDDVLSRYMSAVNGRQVDAVMRLTGDCPALDPGVAANTLDLFLMYRAEIDYASNDTLISGYPDGWDVEVFSLDALQQAYAKAKKSEREHVTTWMRKHLRCKTLIAEQPWTGPKKLSVDTPDDLAVVSQYLNRTLIEVVDNAPDVTAPGDGEVGIDFQRPVNKRGKKA